MTSLLNSEHICNTHAIPIIIPGNQEFAMLMREKLDITYYWNVLGCQFLYYWNPSKLQSPSEIETRNQQKLHVNHHHVVLEDRSQVLHLMKMSLQNILPCLSEFPASLAISWAIDLL